jgi:hypothetical protein
MSFQWIQMRIAEEKERRNREDVVRARLPLAMEELRTALGACASDFNRAFEDQAVEVSSASNGILVSVRQQSGGSWSNRAKVTVSVNPELPGFVVTNGGAPISVQVGMLGGNKIFYKSEEYYLSIEDLTKLILDRVLFPGFKD